MTHKTRSRIRRFSIRRSHTDSGRSVVARVVVASASGAAALLLVALPASAHVEPSPAAVQAGTSASITFGVEHGCDESPLTELEIQIPDEVTDVSVPSAPTGWTGNIVDGVVTFVGGPQPAHEPIDFELTATFPDDPGASVSFATVETCEEGSVSWIDPLVDGQDEPENPAPTVVLTAEAPTAAELAPHEEGDEHEEAEATTSTEATPTTTEAEDASSNTGWFIGVAVVAIFVGALAALMVSRRGRRT
ncbi:hypothetical protein BH10ACT3_BH10ACT3_10520 [soil metagenome]